MDRKYFESRRALFGLCAVLTLCQLATSQTGPNCLNTWITHPSTNVPGGTRQSNVTTVKDCQAACVAAAQAGTCIGVDFDGANACWLIATGTLQADPTNRVTHYELLKEVTACTPACQGDKSLTWTETRHYHINDGTSLGNITFKDCLQRCRADNNCVAFDWDTLSPTDKCYIIANSNPLQDAPFVKNYRKECSPGGLKIVTPGYANPYQGTTPRAPPRIVTDPSTLPRGMSTPSLADYISGESLGIKPAYIVLIGMGGACILMALLAIILLCIYPFGGDRERKERTSVVKTPKVKKSKERTRELQTRVPKSYAGESVGMDTINSVQNSTYSSNKKLYADTEYNKSKRDSYNEPSVHNSYNEPTAYNEVTTHDSYKYGSHDNDDTLDRNSNAYGGSAHRDSGAVYASSHRDSAPYGGSTNRDSAPYGGSNNRDSAVAYGSVHHSSNGDRSSDIHRHSGDHEDRNSSHRHSDHSNLVGTRQSDYEANEEEVENEVENEGYVRNEDYD